MTPAPTAARSTVIACTVCGAKNRVPVAAPGVARCGRCHSPLPWIVDAGDGDFAQVACNASIPVLVDVWAPWCGPCHMVSPILERLAREFAGRVKLVKVDADSASATAARFEVQGIPTLLLMSSGRVVARQTGAAPAPVLRAWLEGALVHATEPAA